MIDALQVRRNFARAAAVYDDVAVLQREIGRRMLERLDDIKAAPARILDLGCGTGAALTALAERYPKAQVVGLDASEAMLRAGRGPRSRWRWLLPRLRGGGAPLLAADASALPLLAGSCGFVWSNLMLHWLADPRSALREMQRVLETGGLLMFSTFGPDTLKELRASFSDRHPHTLRFIDMHDYGDMLLECGFENPVMDVETITMTYDRLDDLFLELRRNGGSCAMQGRQRGLMGRRAWQAAQTAYAAHRLEGRFPASFEVVYGHAWKAQPQHTADSRAIIRFHNREETGTRREEQDGGI